MFPVQISKVPPPDDATRRLIRAAAEDLAETFSEPESPAVFRAALFQKSQELLAKLALPQEYLGWALVIVGNVFWFPWVRRVPVNRRLLLLPHCIRNKEICPAKFSPTELLCEKCGRCSLGQWKRMAEALGTRVMIAEGSPVVLQTIMTEKIDAVLGVACLNSLEKAFDKIVTLGIPALALPLLTSRCNLSEVETDRVEELIGIPYMPSDADFGEQKSKKPFPETEKPAKSENSPPFFPRRPVFLLRETGKLFQPEHFSRLLESVGMTFPLPAKENLHPLALQTENAALEFLLTGGKHFRPFITLASYDALAHPVGETEIEKFPEAVRCVAGAIEIFHKASLVHDDIEDEDAFRYGRPALHTLHGVPAAINMGDYLIGLGYRLLAAQAPRLGAAVTAEILADFSKAHTRLCNGQGMELALQRAECVSLTARDSLRIYALKTAPAFEAALTAGVRMGFGKDTEITPSFLESLSRFCRHLGVGFQILNDLDDWEETATNKITAGGDAVKVRPTVLLALALAGASEAQRNILMSGNRPAIFEIYEKLRVFEQARTLFERTREKAGSVVEEMTHPRLRELLRYFVETILCG